MRMILRRIAFYVVTAIVAITVNFFIPRLMPGNPALAVLGRAQARETPQAIAALELQYLETPVCHGECRSVARHPGTDHDRVESLLDHRALLRLARDAVARVRRQAGAEGFSERRQQPDGIGDDAQMCKVEDRRIPVGVDRDDEVRP